MELSSIANANELLGAVQKAATTFLTSLKSDSSIESPPCLWKFLTANSIGKFRNDTSFNACLRSHSQFLLDHLDKAGLRFSRHYLRALDTEHRHLVKLDKRNPNLKRLAELPVLNIDN